MFTSLLVAPDHPGDPLTAVFLTDTHLVCGTVSGKIWSYDVDGNRLKCAAGFSDDSIRGLYIQDSTIYATVGDSYCKQIRVTDHRDQLETRFERRSSSSGFRHVFQKFTQVTIVYPGMTTYIDVVTNEQSMCPYRLQASSSQNAVPLDAYHYHLLVSEFSESKRKLRVINVTDGQIVAELTPDMAWCIRLVDRQYLFYSNRKDLVVYDYIERKEVVRRRKHKSQEIVGVDAVFHLRLSQSESSEDGRDLTASAPSPHLITTVYASGDISCWDYLTGETLAQGRLAKFCFSLGFPYLVSSNWANGRVEVAVTSDNGCHFVRLQCVKNFPS
jgi:hypothetical protein